MPGIYPGLPGNGGGVQFSSPRARNTPCPLQCVCNCLKVRASALLVLSIIHDYAYKVKPLLRVCVYLCKLRCDPL